MTRYAFLPLLAPVRLAFSPPVEGGRTLEIRRSGKPLAAFPVAGSSGMAAKLHACVAKSPSI